MVATGIVRKVDDLGRIVIPKEIRKTQVLVEGTPIEIFVEGNAVILKKYILVCSNCGCADDLVSLESLRLCPACVKSMKAALA